MFGMLVLLAIVVVIEPHLPQLWNLWQIVNNVCYKKMNQTSTMNYYSMNQYSPLFVTVITPLNPPFKNTTWVRLFSIGGLCIVNEFLFWSF